MAFDRADTTLAPQVQEFINKYLDDEITAKNLGYRDDPDYKLTRTNSSHAEFMAYVLVTNVLSTLTGSLFVRGLNDSKLIDIVSNLWNIAKILNGVPSQEIAYVSIYPLFEGLALHLLKRRRAKYS